MKNFIKSGFLFLLFLIVIFGLGLRFINYDHLPPWRDETMDEFLYPWQGITLLQGKPPVGWSWLNAFPSITIAPKWGIDHHLVTPWLEKPPLYSIILGIPLILNGITDIFDVRLSFIRIPPILLSGITIFLAGQIAKKIFSPLTGLIAALIYAVNPFIIMSNRLSLVENLLTPIILIMLLTIININENKKWENWQIPILGIGSGLAILSKQAGISVLISIISIYLFQKKWRIAIIILLLASIIALFYPALGYYFDWKIFINSLKELQAIHKTGLPQFVSSIFLYPMLGDKTQNRFFLDGTMLLGYILLFSAPFWINQYYQKNNLNSKYLYWFLVFPFSYLFILIMVESGAVNSFYGWYLFPLFPFLTILLSKIVSDVWENYNPGALMILLLILGSSTVRFALMFTSKNIQNLWQYPLGILFFLGFLTFLIPGKTIRKIILFSLFLLYIAVNIYTVINLKLIYPSIPQPQ